MAAKQRKIGFNFGFELRLLKIPDSIRFDSIRFPYRPLLNAALDDQVADDGFLLGEQALKERALEVAADVENAIVRNGSCCCC